MEEEIHIIDDTFGTAQKVLWFAVGLFLSLLGLVVTKLGTKKKPGSYQVRAWHWTVKGVVGFFIMQIAISIICAIVG